VLEVTVGWLLTGAGNAPPPRAERPPQSRREVRPADVPVPNAASMPLDLPVMGTAAGSHARGAFQLEGGIIDFVRRPPTLMGSRTAYALYIQGDSMAPEHPHGALRIIHPDRPVLIGDSAIVQSRHNDIDGVEATIGHYLARTPTVVRLGKLNPQATLEIKRDYIVAVHKVLTVNDLFGV
jgi:phage repressor protein C with HTH and peptisase S24 domain